MSMLLLTLFALGIQGGDCAIVMLSGVPAEPWSALSSEQLEKMWTYGIEGYQVTRSGWSGYALRGPDGSAVFLEDLCASLEADSTVPDSSLWARTLQLVWSVNSLPASVVIEDSLWSFPEMPVRSSRWLEAGADTLILSLPVGNTLLFWAGGFDGEFHRSAWRGIGTEVILSGRAPVAGLVSWSMEGSPGDIISLEYHDTELDQWWNDTWAPLLSIADSLVMGQTMLSAVEQNSVIWIRGSGGDVLCPWTMITSPSPPAVAQVEVEEISGMIPAWSSVDLPGVVKVEMPGNAGSSARAAYAAALLERIAARMLLSSDASVKGTFTPTGEVLLCFSNVEWTPSEAESALLLELAPIIFTAPEAALMNNAAVRAGIPPVDQRETIELLAGVCGFLR